MTIDRKIGRPTLIDYRNDDLMQTLQSATGQKMQSVYNAAQSLIINVLDAEIEALQRDLQDRDKLELHGLFQSAIETKQHLKEETLRQLKASYEAFESRRSQIKNHLLSEVQKSQYQECLTTYFENTVNILAGKSIELPTENIPEYIRLSERYVVLENDRDENKQTIALGNNVEVTLQDTPINDITDSQRFELQQLHLRNTNPPAWFTRLPGFEKRMLLKFIADNINNIANNKLPIIPTSLRHIPGLANYTRHTLTVVRDGKEIAVSTRHRSGVVCPIELYASEYNNERQRITDMNVAQLIQTEFESTLSTHKELWGIATNQKVNYAPVLLQTLLSPTAAQTTHAKLTKPSNDNQMMVTNKNESVHKIQMALDKLYAPHTRAEAEQELSTYGLDYSRLEALGLPTLITTNNAVNKFRKITFSEYDANQEDRNRLMVCVGKFIEANILSRSSDDISLPNLINLLKRFESGDRSKEEKASIKQLAIDLINKSGELHPPLNPQQENAYKLLLQSVNSYMDILTITAENRHRPLFLSSLEQIIAEQCGGIAYGSCKSGKDRKGVEIMHTDAMLIYQSLYGELPQYNDSVEKRQRFISIFVELFISGYSQNISHQNSIGACGLKELGNILPEDIFNAIEARAPLNLGTNKILGKLNDLKDSREVKMIVAQAAAMEHIAPAQAASSAAASEASLSTLSPTSLKATIRPVYQASLTYLQKLDTSATTPINGMIMNLIGRISTEINRAHITPNVRYHTALLTEISTTLQNINNPILKPQKKSLLLSWLPSRQNKTQEVSLDVLQQIINNAIKGLNPAAASASMSAIPPGPNNGR